MSTNEKFEGDVYYWNILSNDQYLDEIWQPKPFLAYGPENILRWLNTVKNNLAKKSTNWLTLKK